MHTWWEILVLLFEVYVYKHTNAINWYRITNIEISAYNLQHIFIINIFTLFYQQTQLGTKKKKVKQSTVKNLTKTKTKTKTYSLIEWRCNRHQMINKISHF